MKAGLFYLFETLGQIEPSEFYNQALDEVKYGEELGFWAACPAEHHFSENYGIMPRVEHFLSFVAGSTSTIKLWPQLVVAPLAHPIRLAEDLALIDQMSRGRVVFSVGSGYRKYEFKPFGADLSQAKARTREITDAVIKLWTEEKVAHKGEFYEFSECTVQPRPFQKPHPMVFCTTTREEQIKWAADRGYGMFPAAGFNPAAVKADMATYDRFCKEAGTEPCPIRPFFKWIYVDEDHERAQKKGQMYILRTLMAFAQGGGKLMEHLVRKSVETWDDGDPKPEWLTARADAIMASGATYDDMVESGWTPYVCGDPDHVFEVLKPYAEAGCNLFIGGFKNGPMPHDDVKNSMRLFAEQVLPRLEAINPG